MDAATTAALDATPLARWGRFVQRRRLWVLLASLLMLGPIVFMFANPGHFRSFDDPIPSTESGKAARLVVDQIPGSQTPTILFILSDASRPWSDPGFKADVNAAFDALRGDSHVTSIVTPYDLPPQQSAGMVSKDGHRVMAIVSVTGTALQADKSYPGLRAKVHSDSLDVVATGGLAFGHDFNTVFAEDLPKAEAASFPVTLVILLIVFGALVAAVLPLAIGILAVAGGVAFTGWIAHFVILPDWSVNLVSLIGLGVAVDYCLFVVNRFREELAGGVDRETALGRALATSGHAVLFSGLTVAVSLGGLAFFQGLDWAGNGYGVAGVVALAILFALTLLPALLAFLGPRVNKGRVGRRAKAEAAMRGESKFWHRTAGAVMRRPWWAIVGVLAIVAVLSIPVFQIRFGGGFSPGQLYEGAESRRGFEILDADFASRGATDAALVVQWRGGDPLTRDHIGDLYDLAKQVAGEPGVVAVDSLVTFDPSMSKAQYQDLYSKPRDQWPAQAQRIADTTLGSDIAVLQVTADLDPQSDAANDLVDSLRTLPEPSGSTVLVGGTTAFVKDSTALIGQRLPLALAFVILSTLALLMVQVRSIVLPFKAVVMNLLSVAASFGVTVWVFQQGHLAKLLHFTPVSMDAGNIVLMFCIVFGLSMDYEVLLLSRMKEAYLRHGDNRRAVQEGLERSGRIITGAALIMVSVFGAFGFMRITFMKMFGVGLGFAVLFDATIIRAVLVPALMRLMGKWNWWAPAWLRPGVPLAAAAGVAVAASPPTHAAPLAVAQDVVLARPSRSGIVEELAPRYARQVHSSSEAEMASVRRWLDIVPERKAR